ncbi:MAG: hypothetical protein AB8I40_10845 [Anaerolineales bacterium]
MVTVKRTAVGSDIGWEIYNPSLRIFIPEGFGPRIMELSLESGPNLLAVLPEARIPVPGQIPFSLRGGHRLWAAPERPKVTYAEDDRPLEITQQEKGLDIHQETDRAGLQKSWQVRLESESPEVTIRHQLVNESGEPIELAPWAVTMLQPGGVGLLPLFAGEKGLHGTAPDRQLIVWPYTDLESPYLQITNEGVFIRAQVAEGMLKIGAPNPAGWLAYSQNETLFVKRSVYLEGKEYPDRGASHQIYCDPGTIELETVGPLVKLAPGDSTDHQETWNVYKDGNWPSAIRDLFDLRGR